MTPRPASPPSRAARRRRALGLGLGLGLAFLPGLASGQVVRDGSFGSAPAGLVAGGMDPLGDMATYLITEDLGERAGSTLYHGFADFSIGPGELATFTGGADVDVVIARNTAPSGSIIQGMFRSTMPNAEFFFASPGGLFVGQGAELDVPGSIHFTTASSIEFAGAAGSTLPTDSSARPTLLAVSPPSAFGFGADPQPISIGVVDPCSPTCGTRTLTVSPGSTLSFIGGDVTLTGLPVGIFAGDVIGSPGSNVQLVAAGPDATIPLVSGAFGTAVDTAALSPMAATGDIRLVQNARIDLSAANGTTDPGGDFLARAGFFRIDDGRIETGHRSDTAPGGRIDIGASQAIELDAARISSGVRGAFAGGDIVLTSDVIEVGDGSSILSGPAGGATGDGGDILITAPTITVDGGAQIQTVSAADSDAGDLVLTARDPSNTGSITIRGEGVSTFGARLPTTLQSRTTRDGRGGTIRLEADTVSLANSADVLSITQGGVTATGGAIEVRTTTLDVDSGSFVAGSTLGPADGGPVSVEGLDGAAASSIRLANSGGEPEPSRLSTNTTSNLAGAGRGGDLTIRTDDLVLFDGGQIFARTEGAGDAGVLDVFADSIAISGILANPADANDPFRAGLTSRVGDTGATGSASLLRIETRLLDVDDGGQISTATFGVGDAARLEIESTERMTVRGGANGASVISAQAVAGPTSPGGGRGGLLSIETPTLQILDGGQITASTAGLGNPGAVGDAGEIVINAGRVEIAGAAGFATSGIFSKSDSAASSGVGNGGNVSIFADEDVLLSEGAQIEVSATGDGDAGNILIDAAGSVRATTGARISSSTGVSALGSSGAVTVLAGEDVSLTGGAEVSASTGSQSTGLSGRIDVRAGDRILVQGASSVRSLSNGFGNAGDVRLQASRILTDSGSAISTEAENASGGSIAIVADRAFELYNARATTSVEGDVGSDAGSIAIAAPQGQVIVSTGAIVARAVQGAGGRIDITASASFVSGDSFIDASSLQGPQGIVEQTPPENDLLAELISLPVALQDPSQLLRTACDLRTEREGSFTVVPRAGATGHPADDLMGLAPAGLVDATGCLVD